jgi:predicted metal-binding protein
MNCTHKWPSLREQRALRVLARLQQPAARYIWTVALVTVQVPCPECKAPTGTFCVGPDKERITQHSVRFEASCSYDPEGQRERCWPGCALYSKAIWANFDGTKADFWP